jgi:UPF0716 protein FxsA
MRFVAWFVLISIAELATFFWVQSWIGLGWALGIALTTALLGSLLVKRAGVSVLGRLRGKVEAGQLPGRELSDGATVLVAGAFLISPGFITDTIGFLLLIPSVRGLVYRHLTRRYGRRFGIFTTRGARPRPDGTWDGELIDVDGWEDPSRVVDDHDRHLGEGDRVE